jgi:hypothetical protein
VTSVRFGHVGIASESSNGRAASSPPYTSS